ncbi:hypothetical protein NC651_021162 [Populus alba x Populus x berolinensis]|nr:hypothetical protein NC651_021162 [Populus alba x Populus x berolinensis]
MRALVILTSSYDKVVIQRNKFRCNQCVLPVELLFPEIKYGLLTSAGSPSIGNSISAACNALEKNCEAQNFYITGASIDQTNPTHYMVLRMSRRKVKLQSQPAAFKKQWSTRKIAVQKQWNQILNRAIPDLLSRNSRRVHILRREMKRFRIC